ncbi:MAG: prolyl oligopeptidase family serine peptidase [Chloroflexota bacterium]
MLNLADLLRVPQVDTGLWFDISPDGRNVAFSWNKTGNWEIYELRIAASSSPLAPLSAKISGAKFSPQYSPNGKYLAYALDLDGSESYHIVLHNLLTATHIDLLANSAYAQQPNFAFSPDGETLAILSDEHGQFALYLLSVETTEKRLLFDIQRPVWDVRWSPDGKWIAAEVEMEASDRGIFIIEVESGKWEQIAVSPSPSALSHTERRLNAQHPAWSPDSKFIAFSAESDEWFDIGVYEIETGHISWLTQSVGDDISPCWSRDGRRISWVQAEGMLNSIMVLEIGVSVKRVQVAAGIHHHPQFASNGEILFLFESPQQPPDLWKLNEDGTFEQLTNSLPDELHDAGFRMPEEVSYDNEGVSVPALLYRGIGDCAVVNIHGGPNWHVQFLWDPFMLHMASRGWTVLAPNYRGSTGYGRAWQIASRFDMGGVDTRDCAAGVDYLLSKGLANRVAVTGRSHGGYLTMTCLTQYPNLWRGGSAVVPFMNWFKSHEDSREDLQHWNIENMGDPKENYETWHNASPYFFLDRVNAPVQLICGGNDLRCPASDSLDAHDKLTELGKDVELLLYEEEGHSFLQIENVIDAEVRRVDFLAKVLEKNNVQEHTWRD